MGQEFWWDTLFPGSSSLLPINYLYSIYPHRCIFTPLLYELFLVPYTHTHNFKPPPHPKITLSIATLINIIHHGVLFNGFLLIKCILSTLTFKKKPIALITQSTTLKLNELFTFVLFWMFTWSSDLVFCLAFFFDIFCFSFCACLKVLQVLKICVSKQKKARIEYAMWRGVTRNETRKIRG